MRKVLSLRSTHVTAENLAVVGATNEFETMFSAIAVARSFNDVGSCLLHPTKKNVAKSTAIIDFRFMVLN